MTRNWICNCKEMWLMKPDKDKCYDCGAEKKTIGFKRYISSEIESKVAQLRKRGLIFKDIARMLSISSTYARIIYIRNIYGKK